MNWYASWLALMASLIAPWAGPAWAESYEYKLLDMIGSRQPTLIGEAQSWTIYLGKYPDNQLYKFSERDKFLKLTKQLPFVIMIDPAEQP